MSETARPILFSAPMVKALLAGTKTQTRRVIKPQPVRQLPNEKPLASPSGEPWTIKRDLGWRWQRSKNWSCFVADNADAPFAEYLAEHCPYGCRGDRLYVRESFCENYFGDAQPGTLKHGYKADWDDCAADVVPRPRWTPGIHMPRRCSRITLEVTSVRVDRLQNISEEDAKAEGVDSVSRATVPRDCTLWHRDDFATLWDIINAKRGFPWAGNCWVWCVSFRRLQ